MTTLNLQNFQLGETIGVGTVGTIFRATRNGSNEEWAIKVLSAAVSNDKLVAKRFEREINILAKLDHPNIVSYFGHGQTDKQLFYAMELVDGGTLKKVLKRGAFSWQEVAECGRQISSALQHAHNHGIIHRDLKPGNVFLTKLGQLKLGDFGIARDLRSTDLTDIGLTVGTYAYMAPELIRGEREITGNVDLYALGCLMFEMLTGRTPYLGDNFAQIFEQHLKSEPPSVTDLGYPCPKEMDSLINQLLEKDPADRPFNARTVQGVLGELCAANTPTETNVNDRGASSVRPVQIQQSLARRISSSVSQRSEISWTALLLTFVVIVGVIICAVIFNVS